MRGSLAGGFEHAEAYFAEARRLAEEAGDKATLATVLAQQGECVRYEGHYARAMNFTLPASNSRRRSAGRTWSQPRSSASPRWRCGQGDPPHALALIEPTLQVWETPIMTRSAWQTRTSSWHGP